MSDEQAGDHSRRFDVHVTAESHFAWLRTRLAVERTMMAYMRTAVALIGFGFGLFQFSTSSKVHPRSAASAFRMRRGCWAWR